MPELGTPYREGWPQPAGVFPRSLGTYNPCNATRRDPFPKRSFPDKAELDLLRWRKSSFKKKQNKSRLHFFPRTSQLNPAPLWLLLYSDCCIHFHLPLPFYFVAANQETFVFLHRI